MIFIVMLQHVYAIYFLNTWSRGKHRIIQLVFCKLETKKRNEKEEQYTIIDLQYYYK